MTDFIKKLESKENLSFEESKDLFSNIMEGKYDEDSIMVVVQLIEPLPKEKHIWSKSYNQKMNVGSRMHNSMDQSHFNRNSSHYF